MTEATPLASEQITQDRRAAAIERVAAKLGSMFHGQMKINLATELADAALSASPAPSGQGVSGEVRCAASPDHADIMETIANAADDWQRNGYTSALAEVRDMANVGRALMEALPEGYSYNDCPSEIVADLQNERDEAYERLAALRWAAVVAALSPQGLDAATVERCAVRKAVRDAWFDGRGTRGSQYDSEAVEAKWDRLVDRALATEPHQHGSKNNG